MSGQVSPGHAAPQRGLAGSALLRGQKLRPAPGRPVRSGLPLNLTPGRLACPALATDALAASRGHGRPWRQTARPNPTLAVWLQENAPASLGTLVGSGHDTSLQGQLPVGHSGSSAIGP